MEKHSLATVPPHFLTFAINTPSAGRTSPQASTGLLSSLHPTQNHIDRENPPTHSTLSSHPVTLCPIHCVFPSQKVSLYTSISVVCLKSLCTRQLSCLTHLQHRLVHSKCHWYVINPLLCLLKWLSRSFSSSWSFFLFLPPLFLSLLLLLLSLFLFFLLFLLLL